MRHEIIHTSLISDNSAMGKKIRKNSKSNKGFLSPQINPCAWARSILPQDILAYIDRSFTQRGMKENVVGRKKKNYPKRSKILKVCPKTGELIYPPGHPRHIDQQKKNEELLSSTNIKKEIDEDTAFETQNENNETELEKAVFPRELQKANSLDIFSRKTTEKLTKRHVIQDKLSNEYKEMKTKSTGFDIEKEDSEADIELDCYNPSTPQVQENIEKILSNSLKGTESPQKLLSNTINGHTESESETNISSDREAKFALEFSTEDSKNSSQYEKLETNNSFNKMEEVKVVPPRNRKSAESDQKSESKNMKVSLSLFKSKSSRKKPVTKKRKISESESILEECLVCKNKDSIIDESQTRRKENKSDLNQIDHDTDDISFCRSKLSETKTTYARRKRPILHTPGSSVHSPAPYETPSYAPSPFSISSPLSPYNHFNNFLKRAGDISQIDMSPSINKNTLDVEDILETESSATSTSTAKFLKVEQKVSTTNKASTLVTNSKESQMPVVQEKPNSTSKETDTCIPITFKNSNKNTTSIDEASKQTSRTMKSKSKIEKVIKSPILTRARHSMDQKNEDAKECRTSINKNHGAPFESVFHRKNEKQLAERIAAFRKKQEKKQQKIKRILEKREAKKAAGLLIEDANEIYYKGIGVTDDEMRSKMPLSSLTGKLTKAENIGGVRRVLKPSSEGFEVVEVKYKEKEIEEAQISNDNNQSNSNKEHDLQKERDLIAELLKIGEKAVEDSSAKEPLNEQKVSSSQFEEFEMAHTSYSPMHISFEDVVEAIPINQDNSDRKF